jgi:small subunit ribosomal protein S9
MVKAKKPVKKTKVKKPEKPKKTEEVAPEIAPLQPERYFEAVGRRKTAVARVRLFTRRGARAAAEDEVPDPGEKTFFVNEKPINLYFPSPELQQVAQAALEKMKCLDKFKISAKVKGGGLPAQAEAIRHGITRALVLFNPDFRKRLKKAGFLTRDPRMRERKKFGLKRARRAPQWSKR